MKANSIVLALWLPLAAGVPLGRAVPAVAQGLGARDTVASGTFADSSGRAGAPGEAGEPKGGPSARYQMPPLSKAIMDHLHNKLIHFPIVLTLVAAVMVIVARKRRELEPVAFWLVWAAALSVIPAYFTGKAAAEHLKGKPKEWLGEVHEKQAITIAVLQALWVLSLLRPGTRRFAWMIGVVLAIVVLSAGYIGGLLAHGH